MTRRAALALAMFCLLSIAARSQDYGPTEGRASWYGEPFHGKKTASGEIFDKAAMTCAHRSLPFGSLIRVRNLDNNASVVVRVNDRGPFVGGRILDLSEAAARILGMIATGTAPVSFSVLPPEEGLAWSGGSLPGAAPPSPPPEPPPAMAPKTAVWRIQVAAFREEANLVAMIKRLRAVGLDPGIEVAGKFKRVVFVGLSKAQADSISAKLDSLECRGYSLSSSTPR